MLSRKFFKSLLDVLSKEGKIEDSSLVLDVADKICDMVEQDMKESMPQRVVQPVQQAVAAPEGKTRVGAPQARGQRKITPGKPDYTPEMGDAVEQMKNRNTPSAKSKGVYVKSSYMSEVQPVPNE